MLRILFAFILSLSGMLFSMPVFAATYISDIALGSAYYKKNVDKAKNELRNNGFTILSDQELCDGMGYSSYYVYFGYKTTPKVEEAITGICIIEGGRQSSIKIGNKVYYPCKGFYENTGGDINAYDGNHTQAYIYITRDGNKDIDYPVLTGLSLVKNNRNTTQGAQIPGGSSANNIENGFNLNKQGSVRIYINTSWHNHSNRSFVNYDNPSNHKMRCNDCNYTFTNTYNHKFNEYKNLDADQHYQKCTDCGYQANAKHEFSSYSSLSDSHAQACNVCGYLISGQHAGLNDKYIAVDDEQHITYCNTCKFNVYEPHEFSSAKFEEKATCSRDGFIIYECKKCGRTVKRLKPHLNHLYTSLGICIYNGCTVMFKEPEYSESDKSYHISNYGELLWFSDHVNAGFVSDNATLTGYITVSSYHPWTPIGKTADLAYKGAFNGNNYVINRINKTIDDNYLGLFGFTDSTAVISNVIMKSCTFKAQNYIGAIAASNMGTISECIVFDCNIMSEKTGAYLGGVCGINKGKILNCSVNDHTIVGTSMTYSGGICGLNNDTIRSNTSAAVNAQSVAIPQVGRGDDDNSSVETNYRGASLLYTRAFIGEDFDATITDEDLHSFGIVYDPSADIDTQTKGTDDTPSDITAPPTPGGGASIRTRAYDLQGRPLTQLKKGVNIIKYPDGQTKKIIIN